MRDRLQSLRSTLPTPVEHREVRTPDEVPGYADWRDRDIADPWVKIGDGVYSDGAHVLVRSAGDPERGVLFWGDEARTIRERHRTGAVGEEN